MSRSLLLFLILSALPSILAAETPAMSTLGNDGEVYTLVSGAYGTLFPGGDPADASSPVLALEVKYPDGSEERIPVPGTQGSQEETGIGLIYDPSHAMLNALWQNDALAGGKLLRLAHFDGDEWSDVVTIKDPTLAPIVRSEALITQDRYLIDVDDKVPQITERTILHLVWTADESGVYDVRYSPIIFLDGAYIGWNETVSLRDLLIDQAPASTPSLTQDLALALALDESRDGQRLQVAFANAVTGDLNVINIGVLPLELAVLGDEIRGILLDLEDLFDPHAPEALGDEARIEIVGTGFRHKLNASLVAYVAVEIRAEILSVASEFDGRYGDLVDHLAQLALDLVHPLVTADLSYIPGLGGSQVLQIDIGDLLGTGQPTQILDLQVLGSVPAPVTGDGPTSIFLSPTADALIVAWEDEAKQILYWRERLADEWGPAHALPLSGISADQARELLQRRVR